MEVLARSSGCESCLNDGVGSGGNTGPQVGALLGNGAGDGGTLHLALGVDDHAGVVLKVDVASVLAAPRLALADDDGGHHLLAQIRLALWGWFTKAARGEGWESGASMLGRWRGRRRRRGGTMAQSSRNQPAPVT